MKIIDFGKLVMGVVKLLAWQTTKRAMFSVDISGKFWSTWLEKPK